VTRAFAILAVLAVLASGSSAFAQAHSAANAAGVVTAVEPHATGQGKTLHANDVVHVGDILKTDKTGRLRIRLNDGSRLTLGGNSQMKVALHDAASRQTSVELASGRLRSSLEALTQSGAKYEVRTAMAVAGVIGTDFEVEVTPDGTLVTCYEGRVMVSSLLGLGSVTLGPGESIKATATEMAKPSPSTSSSTANPGGNSGSMVYTSGGATVNGAAITQSAALLDGDILDNGAATLSLVRKGSTLTVGSNSRLAITENNLRLGCGDAVVKTSSGMSALAPGYGVTPSGLSARYEVIQTPTQLQILAHEGDIWVFVGNKLLTVPTGQMLSLPGECIDDAALRTSIPEARPITVSSGTFARMSSGHIPLTRFILVGAGVGAAVGVTCFELCSSNDRKPISPSAP